MNEQIPYSGALSSIQLASNPEPRCACALVLDVSGSMEGEPLEELQRGVQTLLRELSADPLASRRVELAVVTFGGTVKLASDFVSPDRLQLPPLSAHGGTPMGEAVVLAASALNARKRRYQEEGIQYFRPWMFLLTDGEPTDRDTPHWKESIQIVHQSEQHHQLLFFAVAVNEADQSQLNLLCPPQRPSLKLKGLHFRELFVWLTRSLKMVSESSPGQKMSLPPTSGWNEIAL
jgi:uncharacterized protein YegL